MLALGFVVIIAGGALAAFRPLAGLLTGISLAVSGGIAGAVLSGRLLESLVDGAKSVNATTYAASVLFIALVAAIAIWVATRPIARLDIAEILRTE